MYTFSLGVKFLIHSHSSKSNPMLAHWIASQSCRVCMCLPCHRTTTLQTKTNVSVIYFFVSVSILNKANVSLWFGSVKRNAKRNTRLISLAGNSCDHVCHMTTKYISVWDCVTPKHTLMGTNNCIGLLFSVFFETGQSDPSI